MKVERLTNCWRLTYQADHDTLKTNHVTFKTNINHVKAQKAWPIVIESIHQCQCVSDSARQRVAYGDAMNLKLSLNLTQEILD